MSFDEIVHELAITNGGFKSLVAFSQVNKHVYHQYCDLTSIYKRSCSLDVRQQHLIQAIEHGDLGELKQLLKINDIDPTFNQQSILKTACKQGSLSLVTFLLEDSRFKVEANDQAPFDSILNQQDLSIDTSLSIFKILL